MEICEIVNKVKHYAWNKGAPAAYSKFMPNSPAWIASCSLAVLIALYIVGAVSHGSLRHEVQTLPLWIPIVLGFRRSQFTKWAALPCFLFWLTIVIFIWLFLLGWAQILRGHFSSIEIAMTVLIWTACCCGLAVSLRWRTETRLPQALAVLLLSGAFQWIAFRLSFIPFIASQ